MPTQTTPFVFSRHINIDGGAPAHADNPFYVSPLLFSPLTSGFRGRKAPNG